MIRKQFPCLVYMCVFEVCYSVVLQCLAACHLPVIETMQCVYKEKKRKQAGEMEQVKADTSDIHNIFYQYVFFHVVLTVLVSFRMIYFNKLCLHKHIFTYAFLG